MTFEGQEKPGQHAKQRRTVKTGKDKAKEGWGELRGGGGVYPTLKGGTLPRTQDSSGRAGLEILIATFLAISLLFFFASFFDAISDRFLVDFASQLGT